MLTTFRPNYNLDLRSHGQLLSLFLFYQPTSTYPSMVKLSCTMKGMSCRLYCSGRRCTGSLTSSLRASQFKNELL